MAIAAPDSRYVFNQGGQEINVSGLLCLHDAEGPCANGVKDSQRTKTRDATREVLYVLWGTRELPGHTETCCAYAVELLRRAGAEPGDPHVLAG